MRIGSVCKRSGSCFLWSSPCCTSLPYSRYPISCATGILTFPDRKVSSTMVRIGVVGFGCYRVDRDVPEHRVCLETALKGGVNLIDTSANYGDGSAEELIGDVLNSNGFRTKRADLVVVSKFGYIQGQNLQRYLQENLRFPDTVDLGSHLKHCVHPDFMKDQLQRSLERMQLQYIDVFLLHNPEYYITDGVSKLRKSNSLSEQSVKQLQTEMLRRIHDVFEALEHEVQISQRIRGYGISSNSFSLKESDPCFLPYATLVEIAEKAAQRVSGNKGCPSGFTVVQMPGNLVETEGLHQCARWASNNGLMVLLNRPLNAFSDQGSWRLAEYSNAAAVQCETKGDELLKELRASGAGHEAVCQAIMKIRHEILPSIRSVFDWEGHGGRCSGSVISQALHKDRVLSYERHDLVEKIQVAREDMLRKFGYSIPDSETLQMFSLKFLIRTPGVTCVLLGARKEAYVRDMLQALTISK
eukprot:GHVQ01043324.1.p1 GENE.GHVQ01043324.1~~GHVQ01043324.1.p1  ORF type:complete len:470 (-),score=24.27 GHVQ01043324.1:1998-3407(-)